MNTNTVVLLLIVGISALIVDTNGARHSDCLLPLDPGMCRAGFKMWGFDTAINKCRKFPYGGCDGNANAFTSQEECIAKCADKPEAKTESPAVPNTFRHPKTLRPEDPTKNSNTVSDSCGGKCPKCSTSQNIIRT